MNLWTVMVVGGLVTFLIRFSFIGAEGVTRPPAWFVRLLPYVPVAALTALIVPELLLVDGTLALGTGNARLWAGVVAILLAARWRNSLLTIGGGFLALFLLQRL